MFTICVLFSSKVRVTIRVRIRFSVFAIFYGVLLCSLNKVCITHRDNKVIFLIEVCIIREKTNWCKIAKANGGGV